MTDLNPEGLEKAAEELNEAGWTCDGGSHEPMGINACPECREVCTDLARAAVTAYLDHAHARTDIPELIELVNEQRADLERTKRGAHTLGQIIEQNGRDVLDATGMHDVINADGDGDWQVVWEKLSEMGGTIRKHQAALTAVLDALDDLDSKHQIHGHECLCGFASARSRSRTEHLTAEVRAAITEHLGGDRG